MTNEEKIIQLLEEQNRLLSIFVQPVVALQSQQLAKMSREERKANSKAVLARAKARARGEKN
ncbi:MAG: hypothetical protein LHW45_10700 [Candidatus Cloacimonetes bacterium]|nr:hypothetical protein [Candidatus Cloacimonadota bacterium]MDY0368078.1 hypothetical protein [Candidatus Syntrophosphaera sp.]